LRELADGRRYAPRAAHEEPVQIMAFDQAAGIACDHLFIADATADRWPASAGVTPYLAREALRAAGVAEAAPDLLLARARRLAAHLPPLAPQVTVYAPREDDRGAERMPSPLFGADWHEAAATAPLGAAERMAAQGSRAVLPHADPVPPVDEAEMA